jgi:aminoglycoside phosphotransferase (APT) family kinase protein
VFVDFERAALGDPLDDLGNLLAHLAWEHATLGPDGAAAGPFAEALAHEYAARTAPSPSGARAFHEACALVEIAELPVRRRLPGAAEVAGRALAMARAALDRPAD